MRVAVLFFLSLCFFLSGLSGHVHAETGQDKKVTHTIKFTNPKSQSRVTKNDAVSDDTIYLVNVEDEEDDISSARRYVLLANHFATCLDPFISGETFSSSRGKELRCRSLSRTSSCKYLVLRALRI